MEMQKTRDAKSPEEYETQYFSFGRQALKESLKNLVESKLQTLIQEAQKYFTSSSNLSEQYKQNVSSKCVKLLEFCTNKSAAHLSQINIVLDKYFSIPEYVLLPEDENHQNVAQEEVDGLKREVEEMLSKISSLQLSQAHLEHEIMIADSFQYVFEEDKMITDILQGMQRNKIPFPDKIHFDKG